MKGMSRMGAARALLTAGIMGAFGGTQRDTPKGLDEKNEPKDETRKKRRRALSESWKPGAHTPPGCKGAKSMTAAQQKRSAKKRNNIRKNPRGAK